jgi:hypothetical protein
MTIGRTTTKFLGTKTQISKKIFERKPKTSGR